jgi:hypothetical protein
LLERSFLLLDLIYYLVRFGSIADLDSDNYLSVLSLKPDPIFHSLQNNIILPKNQKWRLAH